MNPLTAGCFPKTATFWLVIADCSQTVKNIVCKTWKLNLLYSLLLIIYHKTALIKLGKYSTDCCPCGFLYTKNITNSHSLSLLRLTFARARIFSLFRARFGGRARTMLVIYISRSRCVLQGLHVWSDILYARPRSSRMSPPLILCADPTERLGTRRNFHDNKLSSNTDKQLEAILYVYFWSRKKKVIW